MKRILFALILLSSCAESSKDYDFITHFEKSEGLETATYEQTIAYYVNLAEVYSTISIEAIGETDSGKPLHLVTYNPDASFNFDKIRGDKQILLINNGIHPGESDGIDATMMLFRDLAQQKISTPQQTVIATIPIYNIGGSLNRNSTSRTNQNGPKAYGFRGNARNYDLNRDFIKSDTKNAKTFAQLFHKVQPDVFIDNHVSNGADYQYILTHLFTQHNKLGGDLGEYLNTEMMPKLEDKLSEKDWDITPYVNVFNRTPDNGFSQFMDSPRYSTGYTTLFNTLGMMVETHMLKPYKQRVDGTYELMKSMIDIVEVDGSKIKTLRSEANETYNQDMTYPLKWTIDTTRSTTLEFKGYEGQIIPSTLTGGQRLKYDKSKPFTKSVKYQNFYKPSLSIDIPKAYVIPQSWHTVIELLQLNNVEMSTFEKDTTLIVESYRIANYNTRRSPYEGHYLHYNTEVKRNEASIIFKKGDYIVHTDQKAMRYLIETLEPQGVDSFFNWNFFDTILQQKEGFSPYVWEDKAEQWLRANPKLRIDYNLKKTFDSTFAKNTYAQLDWIHKNSPNYEKAHMQYPIYRLKH
ncbi:MAG: M14 family metallopeptidase [Bacteroidota bacterium]